MRSPACWAEWNSRRRASLTPKRALSPATRISMAVAIAGCSWQEPHKVEVQQGNILDASALAELRAGMSKKQVRFLLGNPIINDTFHPHRWDYIYFEVPAGKPPTPKRLTLFFEGNVLTHMVDLYTDPGESGPVDDRS